MERQPLVVSGINRTRVLLAALSLFASSAMDIVQRKESENLNPSQIAAPFIPDCTQTLRGCQPGQEPNPGAPDYDPDRDPKNLQQAGSDLIALKGVPVCTITLPIGLNMEKPCDPAILEPFGYNKV